MLYLEYTGMILQPAPEVTPTLGERWWLPPARKKTVSRFKDIAAHSDSQGLIKLLVSYKVRFHILDFSEYFIMQMRNIFCTRNHDAF